MHVHSFQFSPANVLFQAPAIETQAFPAVTRLRPHIGSRYWAMDMFRFFTPKENIIRIWEWISLFPHVRNSEVMAASPPARTVALDLTFHLLALHSTHTNAHTDYRFLHLKFQTALPLTQTVSKWSFFSFSLSSIWTVSAPAVVWSDTQPDNRVGPKWNQKQFVLVWAIIPFPISHASPFSPLSPSLYLLPRIKRNDFRHSYKKQLLSNFPLRNILKAIPDLHILFQITSCMPFREPQGWNKALCSLRWSTISEPSSGMNKGGSGEATLTLRQEVTYTQWR